MHKIYRGEGWPSGKMLDCNARGCEFKCWLGQNKFTKSDGQWRKIVNTYLCSVCPMLSMHSVMVSGCII